MKPHDSPSPLAWDSDNRGVGDTAMADRHMIVVRVRDGTVAGVEFCDCCPGVTVEVRAYTDDPGAVAKAQPVWYLGGGPVPAVV